MGRVGGHERQLFPVHTSWFVTAGGLGGEKRGWSVSDDFSKQDISATVTRVRVPTLLGSAHREKKVDEREEEDVKESTQEREARHREGGREEDWFT